ncbi:RNA polymerase sigma factor [Elongatibacter sediminis]|uniref:Sigma-70 family RNA polymerase sigma factor n=1 Tax=Elongatibacter sediminis TaxID=3119006 RepID=A0AAW9RDZ4_9GAMM
MQEAANQDRNLVDRIRSGDAEAETELVTQFSRGVGLMLLKHTGDVQVAHDLSQETFVVALRRLRAGELRRDDRLGAFIRQIAVNLSIQHFRREKRFVHSADGIIQPQVALKDRTEEKLDRSMTRELLVDVLDQLSMPRDRELLRRFYLNDEDKESICQDLGLSAQHFDRVLYRARQRMRELIEQQKGLRSLLFGGLLDG